MERRPEMPPRTAQEEEAVVARNHAADVETVTEFLASIDQPGVKPVFQDVADMHSEHVHADRAAESFGTPVSMHIVLRGGQITGFAAKLRELMEGSE